MRTANDSTLDDAVFLWFIQRRSVGEPISGPLLYEKALDLNKKMGGPSEFKASTGWLKTFKSRHGIRELHIEGEILSGDFSAAESFKTKFKDFIDKEGYSRGSVYNADETEIFWKSLPRKSLASRRKESAPGHKVTKDRVTAMVCPNADGTHSLPLLVIGKAKRPPCFKNVACLPISYKAFRTVYEMVH